MVGSTATIDDSKTTPAPGPPTSEQALADAVDLIETLRAELGAARAARTASDFHPHSARQPVLKLEAPSKFTGYEKAGSVPVATELRSWLSVMTAYIRRVTPLMHDQSAESVCEYAMGFLEGDAHTVAERTRAEHLESGGGTVDWAVITAGLCARFAPTRNDLDLIDKLRSVEQGAGSVASYTRSFESVLDELRQAQVGDRSTVVHWFLDGLRPEIGRACREAISNVDGDALARIPRTRITEAVSWVAALAGRKETMLNRSRKGHVAPIQLPGSDGQVSRVAAVLSSSSSPAASAAPAVDGSTFVSRRLAAKFGISEVLVRSRLDGGLCVKCGIRGHRQNDCAGSVKAASSKGSARVNTARVDGSSDESDASVQGNVPAQ
jgi:Retrotransposon gag protein